MPPYAPESYVASASQTDFAITWPYVRDSYVKLYIDAVPSTAFTLVTSGTVLRLDTPATGGEAITIERVTSSTPVTDFQGGASITEGDLDDVIAQAFHYAEEAVYNSVAGMTKTGGQWDATSLRITNVSDPLDDADVATKGAIGGQVTAAQAAQTAAEAAQTAAETAETNAETAETNAVAAEVAAEAAAATVPSISGGDAGKHLRVNSGETAFELNDPLTPDYTSAWTAASISFDISFSHSLGARPRRVELWFRLESGQTDGGWSDAYEFPMGNSFSYGDVPQGVGFGATTTVVYVSMASLYFVNRTSNVGFDVNESKWEFQVRAWK